MMDEDYDDPYLRESYKHYTQELLHDQSMSSQLTNKYWTAKSFVKKLKKKEDQSVVAADSDLDAKLEFFRSVQETTQKLVFCIERYQDAIMALSQEENKLGRFLKEQSQVDKSPAGKMMSAIGKQLSQTSQQRLSCRVPLVRLYGDLDTFRNRAISDTNLNVQKMEALRLEYRGTLMRMKDVSEELNPDAYRQLERFRKVQAQVKINRDKFERHKYAVCQKIDLLGASRCNLLSHDLEVYHQNMLAFWQRTAKEMSEICEQFKGHQHYEWSMLKELNEPALKLHEQLEQNMKVANKSDESQSDKTAHRDDTKQSEDDKLISWDDHPSGQDSGEKYFHSDTAAGNHTLPSSSQMHARNHSADQNSSGGGALLMQQAEEDVDLLSDFGHKHQSVPMQNFDPSQRFASHMGINSPTPSRDENFFDDVENSDFFNDLMNPSESSDNVNSDWTKMWAQQGAQSSSRKEPPMQSSMFSASEHFGLFSDVSSGQTQPGAESGTQGSSSFLPSQLMDLSNLDNFESMLAAAPPFNAQTTQSGNSNPFQQPVSQGSILGGSSFIPGSSDGGIGGGVPGMSQGSTGLSSMNQSARQSKQKQDKSKAKADMSAWFNLFADLDPLGNPDAVGNKDQQADKIGI